MKVYLTMGRDGRILIQGRLEQGNNIGYVLHYVASGETFNGVAFDDFAKSTPGPMELPEAPSPEAPQPDVSQADPEAIEPQPSQTPGMAPV